MDTEDLADEILKLLLEAGGMHGSKALALKYGVSERDLTEAVELLKAKNLVRQDTVSSDSAFHVSLKENIDSKRDEFIQAGGFRALKQQSLQLLAQVQQDQQKAAHLQHLQIEKLQNDLKDMKWIKVQAWIALALSAISLIVAIKGR